MSLVPLLGTGAPAGAAGSDPWAILEPSRPVPVQGLAVPASQVLPFAADNIWAADHSTGPGDAGVRRWDGQRWLRVRLADESVLVRDLAGTSGSDVWVLGRRQVSGVTSLVVQHWNGRSWRSLPALSDNPTRSVHRDDGNALQVEPNGRLLVSGVTKETASGTTRAAVFAWDGQRWSDQPLPGTAGAPYSEANDVDSGGGYRWAVGAVERDERFTPLVARQRPGGAWTQLPLPAEVRGLARSVTPVADNQVWVTGTLSADGRAVTLRWNGQAWQQVPVESELFGPVSEVAAGRDGQLATAISLPGQPPVLLAGDGRGWRRLAALPAQLATEQLSAVFSVSFVGPSRQVAVGGFQYTPPEDAPPAQVRQYVAVYRP